MQRELELKDQQIQNDREVFKKESLKQKRSTEGLLSATFNLDSHNQCLKDVSSEIGRLSRWYEKAMQDKRRWKKI